MKKIIVCIAALICQNLLAQSVVTVNPDRTISLNGSKFFPISVYLQSDWSGAASLGINTASRPFCTSTSALAQCEANHLYGHLTVGPSCDKENAQSIRDRETSVFTNSVNQFKNSNYIFGYGLPDEPISSEHLSVADTKWAYDLIKSKDPNHVVFFTDYASDVSAHKNSADIFLNDEYPFNNSSNPLYDIKTKFKNMLNQVAPKPAWLVIQTGSQFGVPSDANIRAETYLSIALGSTGIIFYSYDVADSKVHNIKKDGDPAFMKNLISELKSFSPYFLAPTSSSLSYTSNDVDAILKDLNGKSYLIAVNKNPSARNISFTLAGNSNATARIIGTAAAGSVRTGQSITISSSGVMTDVLQGLEAVVYEISKPTTGGDGLTGNYFNGMNFETPVYSRVDPNINFDWSNDSPYASVNTDRFSVRWSGQIQADYTENYTFYLNTDNGRRLWINGQLLVDSWIDDWNKEYTGTIALTAGQKYDIRLEYFENYGGASCKMEWSSVSQSRQVVPQSHLYRNPLPVVSISSPAANVILDAGTITLTASASDNTGIAKIEFFNGPILLGTSTTNPYRYTWSDAAAGNYSLTARATDNLGGITVSSVVNIIVKATAVNKAPSVSLTSPGNGSGYTAPVNITLSATASDTDGSVVKVEFYNGHALLGSSSSTVSPYSYTWTNIGAGVYTITAKAYDNSGGSSVSGSTSVTVTAVGTNSCSGWAQYAENNGYVAGSLVRNSGVRFQCKEWPYSGWCNGAAWAYAPGTGAYWTDAWYNNGSCSSRTSDGNKIEGEEQENVMLLTPNPVGNTLSMLSTIDLSGGHIRILNAWGVEILAIDSYTSPLNVSSLPSGSYILIWAKGYQSFISHFVK